HPGPRPRRAHVELVELVGRAVPPDRQHVGEGRRLHDRRRRPRGLPLRHLQRPEDRRHVPARAPPGPAPVRGHPPGARLPGRPELAENQEGEKELMPFPILDACFALYAGEKLGPTEMKAALASMFPEVSEDLLASHVARFVKMFNQSIYKWVQ